MTRPKQETPALLAPKPAQTSEAATQTASHVNSPVYPALQKYKISVPPQIPAQFLKPGYYVTAESITSYAFRGSFRVYNEKGALQLQGEIEPSECYKIPRDLLGKLKIEFESIDGQCYGLNLLR